MAVSFTAGGDFIIPSEDGQTYLGGAGDDLYILSGATVRPNATIVIQDTQGTNNIQLIGGLSIASSLVTSNALELTLSNNAKVQILGANNFGYDVGGNIFVDVEGTQQDFATFVTQTLGTTVPGPGEPFSTGGAVTIPVGGMPDENVVDMAAGGSYTGTEGEGDVFQYELDSSSGRAVGKDGEVSITGFTAGEDRIEFVDAGDNLTTANFETFPGVSLAENPFADNTVIAFDPDAGVANVITLAGIQDAELDTIDYLVV